MGEESIWPIVSPASYLHAFQVVASLSTAWLESRVLTLHTCQAVCDLVRHGEASSMLTLLKSLPLQYLQHCLHTRGVIVPVKGEVNSSVLDHINLGVAFLVVGVPYTGDVFKNRPDHCLVLL